MVGGDQISLRQGVAKDPLQAANRNAMAQFTATARMSNAPGLASKVISNALGAPGLFAFTELYNEPNIQGLKGSEHEGWLRALETFMWGTWAEYNGATDLPSLSPAQAQKLKQLTLASLGQTLVALTFSSLQSNLSLSSDLELSRLFTSAIDAGLIKGTLDSANGVAHIDTVYPLRDLAPGELDTLIETLSEWEAHCKETLDELEERTSQVKGWAEERRRDEQAHEERFETAVAEAPAKNSKKRGGGVVENGPDAGVGASGSGSGIGKGGRNTRQR